MGALLVLLTLWLCLMALGKAPLAALMLVPVVLIGALVICAAFVWGFLTLAALAVQIADWIEA